MRTDGAALIAAERLRHVAREGWTPAHDDLHGNDEMAKAASFYAMPSRMRRSGAVLAGEYLWPWENRWFKPTPDDRVRELVKAGALIAAEIDRLTRALEGEPVD